MLESVKFLDQCFSILLFIVVILLFKRIYICDTFYAVNICFYNCAIVEEAALALTAGKNIYTFKETNVYALAHTVDIKAKREIDPAKRIGYYNHFHVRNVSNAHVFFGYPMRN